MAKKRDSRPASAPAAGTSANKRYLFIALLLSIALAIIWNHYSQHKTSLVHASPIPVLMRLPQANFVDDKAGKPVGINEFVGRRPIAAFGNSDGDQQMLEWTAAGSGARFALLVHHDDSEREWAYDRTSPIGKLDKAWDEAIAKGWTVVSMKNDWQ